MKQVSVLVGAGSIGQAIIRRVSAGKHIVLAISEGAFAGKPTSYYDLFRVENGKIAEHWDVMETIAPESEWKHQNGKYGFPE